ncbi:MAG: acyl-CoA dehydrogenase C-terminal domain-containing protein [Gammaproteobacteria bacterium]|nr:acyl-CoA dehydrogenase C-terminal domain-containing protein [Gammaproteobacteria bacterium]
MLEYRAPERDFEFLLFELYRVQESWRAISAFADFSDDIVRAVLAEGGKLAAEVMAPLNQSGDDEGCRWEDGEVHTPSGFREAFAQIASGGWMGLSGNPEFAGQGLPKLLGCLVEEMFWGSNTGLYLYCTLTVGASICIDTHGSPEQKALYLPKLYSGTWTGAMSLTESHAGTDLGIMRTRAEAQGDGTYRLTGTKIFITSGEHDVAENIVHLVLAKLPGAPSGSRGISLFIVPKYLPTADGEPGERNKLGSGSIEHKMGIKGSATSVMNFDGAVGYLIGEENQGLACMFTMMNYERLSVGIQGLGAGELAYQQAAVYARERLQGRSPLGPQNPDAPADSLLVHPDVRRMLLTIRTLTEAGRAFALFVGMQLDLAKYAKDAEAQALAELLTPVAKAFLSDRGFDCAVTAQQVFGGHGYVKEWGVEQIVRDVRIAQIYEGANGIQALDLVGRKVLRDGGNTVRALVDRITGSEIPLQFQERLREALDRLTRVTTSIVDRAADDPALAGAVSTDYLDLLGYTLYAWLWAAMAEAAPDDDFGAAKWQCAEFYFARILPKTRGLETSIEADSSAVMQLPDSAF